jgi:hypothetical protein
MTDSLNSINSETRTVKIRDRLQISKMVAECSLKLTVGEFTIEATASHLSTAKELFDYAFERSS